MSAGQPNTITVLVPSYRRPELLVRCLLALEHQNRPPDEVIVVVRQDDEATWTAVRHYVGAATLGLRTAAVATPGCVQALNVGLQTARGAIIAITDDDAIPWPDWIERIDGHFRSDPTLAGVGGRDWLHIDGFLIDGKAGTVGKVTWWGRHIGNHHLGTGASRAVDVLKGVNCAYRRSMLQSIGFDPRLRGSGAQVHYELCLGLALRKNGCRLLYDPAIAVDHHPGPRHDNDQRFCFDAEATENASHNETVAILEYMPRSRWPVYLAWAVLVGHRGNFGLAQWVRFTLKGERSATAKLVAGMHGRLAGWRTVHSSGRTGPAGAKTLQKSAPIDVGRR